MARNTMGATVYGEEHWVEDGGRMDKGRRTRTARSCVSRSMWVVLRMGVPARASQHRLIMEHQSEAMQDSQQSSSAGRAGEPGDPPQDQRSASQGAPRQREWPTPWNDASSQACAPRCHTGGVRSSPAGGAEAAQFDQTARLVGVVRHEARERGLWRQHL